MAAVYTEGFVREFDRLASKVIRDGPDGRSPQIVRLVVRVANQAKLLNPEDWRAELDAICRDFRTRLAGQRSPDDVCLKRGQRYREFYEDAVARLQAAGGLRPDPNY